ncbi:MAG: hypothetical protein LBQ61_08340 [Spirochaetales bacterium]|nr:hypothetical protein [Spirochaetales bacterium]
MDHPRTIEFEETLRTALLTLDAYLEDRWGEAFPLHPARPPRGQTSGGEMDGLFNVGASFTPGFGSRLGRGWAVDIHLATLAQVSPEVRRAIQEEARVKLVEELARVFPGRRLLVEEDGGALKIHGDLSLGSL